MKNPEMAQLYQRYLSERAIALDEEQFHTIVMFFPALLVIACDGHIDEEEWMYVGYLARSMAETYPIQHVEQAKLQETFYQELEFLLKNLHAWEKPFLQTLKGYLSFNPSIKDDILDILYLFAEASDGESDTESQKIDLLKNQLTL
jgi:hypothetical protein